MTVDVVVVGVCVGLVLIVLMVFTWRWCCFNNNKQQAHVHVDKSLQAGIAQLQKNSNRSNTKGVFNWADHPSLITDAVENGWSRFGFTNQTTSSPSIRSSLLSGFCAAADSDCVKETHTDITWEVCQGSADFMQKIRLNSGLRKMCCSVISTSLPLPGPHSAFPQEAYFEITILYSQDHHQSINEGDRIKLIQDSKTNGLSLPISKDDVKSQVVMLSLGLTTGGGASFPLKLPGTYPGSIGFNSSGSVYLDGIKLATESEKQEWGQVDKVIGCGYDPRQKKVFFTIDSELVHVIHCKSEEFGSPLYPTIAANVDVLVLVNFGQSAFTYTAANANRTSNPCFIGPVVNSSPAAAAALGYEDSKELFSMGRIDSQWLNRSSTKCGHNNAASEFDEESEADLFDIVLDGGYSRSPNIV